MVITRRDVLGGLAGLGAAGLVAPQATVAAPDLALAYPPMMKFRVEREGSFIGHVMQRYDGNGSDLTVDVFIEFDVKLAFITLFRYEHRAREIWRDGRLVRLDSVTNDNGDPQQVAARRYVDSIVGTGPLGEFEAPGDILPSSYWHPRFPEQSTMLDSQMGRVLAFDIAPQGVERILARGDEIEATRYAMRGDIDLDFWYDAERVWQKMAFTIKGGYMEYTRVQPADSDNALFATPLSTGVTLPPAERV